MKYLERLLRRAVALPRAQAESLFDPFDSVADWPVEVSSGSVMPPPSATGGPIAATGAAPESGRAVRTAAASPAPPARPAPPVPAQPPTLSAASGEPEAIQPLQAARPPEPRPAAANPRPAAEPRESPAESTQESAPSASIVDNSVGPLAAADSFMRTLGVPAIPPDAGSEPGEPAGTRVKAEPDRPAPALRSPPVQPVRPEPPAVPQAAVEILRPPLPRFVAPLAAAPPDDRVRSPAPASEALRPPPAASASRAPPPPAARRGSVPPRSRESLDDLAHSRGILRFGIGQG